MVTTPTNVFSASRIRVGIGRRGSGTGVSAGPGPTTGSKAAVVVVPPPRVEDDLPVRPPGPRICDFRARRRPPLPQQLHPAQPLQSPATSEPGAAHQTLALPSVPKRLS